MTSSPPTVTILHGLQGAAQAKGIAVVIDVLRAFSTACHIVAAGARNLFVVAEVERARQMKLCFPDAVLVGERGGYRIPGFDLGNSPSRIKHLNWRNRTAILTTSNGTSGLTKASRADEVLTGSFVNAEAIIRHIQHRRHARVSLVPMGSAGAPTLEDTLCARYLEARLSGGRPEFGAIRQRIWQSAAAARFLTGPSENFPREDLTLCLELDRFDFVLKVVRGKDGLQLEATTASDSSGCRPSEYGDG